MITKDQAFSKSLPKWPQCIIRGQNVTIEQAKDIIFKTDRFFSGRPYCGGNNHDWNSWAHVKLGFNIAHDLYQEASYQLSWDFCLDFAKHFEILDLCYLGNNWASCSYIGGPHGFCSPTGQIKFDDNVGKWPSVAAIYDDLIIISKAFPYLNLSLTLMSGESLEKNNRQVVTMVLKNQKIRFYENFDIPSVESPDQLQKKLMSFFAKKLKFNGGEQGLPDDWIVEFGQKTKPYIENYVKQKKLSS